MISDVEYSVVKEMLNFIYCGKTSIEASEIASELLIAADKYRQVTRRKGAGVTLG